MFQPTTPEAVAAQVQARHAQIRAGFAARVRRPARTAHPASPAASTASTAPAVPAASAASAVPGPRVPQPRAHRPMAAGGSRVRAR